MNKSTNELLNEYIELANQHGWWSMDAVVWRFRHRRNTDLMGLISNVHHVRSLFRRGYYAAINQWSQGQR